MEQDANWHGVSAVPARDPSTWVPVNDAVPRSRAGEGKGDPTWFVEVAGFLQHRWLGGVDW